MLAAEQEVREVIANVTVPAAEVLPTADRRDP